MWKIITAIIVVALLGGGGFYYYQTTQNNSDTTAEEKTEDSETPTETPTPEEVKKDEFKIVIQNGSGIAGEAGRAQTLLEDEEFVVDSVANADNYDYEETVIQTKEDVSEAWVDELMKALEKKYTVKSKPEQLDADSESDVIVIVGSFDKDGKTMAVEEEETPAASDEAKAATPTPKDE